MFWEKLIYLQMPLDLINNIHTILSAKIHFGAIAYSDSNASKPDQKNKKIAVQV